MQFGSIVLNDYSKFGLAMNFASKFANELLSYVIMYKWTPLANISTSSKVEISFILALLLIFRTEDLVFICLISIQLI